ncbi:MAG: M23 family metallopeptidase [Polyangiaceae bacterium]|nr:M23 family metallopeptidase [Polyangiaceae bacterium]
MRLLSPSSIRKLQTIGAVACLGGALGTSGCGRDAAARPALPPSGVALAQGARLHRDAIRYRMPVVGLWRVHRTHYGSRNDQAYALDLVAYTNESFARKTKRTNADYSSYGQPIVADAPGVIVIAVDGVPDNEPGVVNKYDLHGNYVVIDHENGEYSLMAHFIPGSLTVRKGQRVEAGAQLGLCGNSGQSTMPHLHWQVMDNPLAHLARGVAPRYLPYERNGDTTQALPDRGDTVESP